MDMVKNETRYSIDHMESNIRDSTLIILLPDCVLIEYGELVLLY